MCRIRIRKVNSWLIFWRGSALGETAMCVYFN